MDGSTRQMWVKQALECCFMHAVQYIIRRQTRLRNVSCHKRLVETSTPSHRTVITPIYHASPCRWKTLNLYRNTCILFKQIILLDYFVPETPLDLLDFSCRCMCRLTIMSPEHAFFCRNSEGLSQQIELSKAFAQIVSESLHMHSEHKNTHRTLQIIIFLFKFIKLHLFLW